MARADHSSLSSERRISWKGSVSLSNLGGPAVLTYTGILNAACLAQTRAQLAGTKPTGSRMKVLRISQDLE
jgi:hypothetical protein